MEERKNRYLYAISESLKHIPSYIQPILVENNGERQTYLDQFEHNGKKVPVVYTNNNVLRFKSKGVNELLDLKEVIQRMGIHPEDMIVKLTGRYRILSSTFLEEVASEERKIDAFVKFFGTCSLQFEKYDCILGYYVIRANYLLCFHHQMIDNNKSAEIAFAKYVRLCGANIKEIENLEVECIFAEDNRILKV